MQQQLSIQPTSVRAISPNINSMLISLSGKMGWVEHVWEFSTRLMAKAGCLQNHPATVQIHHHLSTIRAVMICREK